jgi:tetratricopeptide (TPR) repeat protein
MSGPGYTCERCSARGVPGELERHFPEGAGPALARANLLRMRGKWAEAAEQCVDVLRRDPTNPTAHSLLGDIYQDQGRMEEARHWYHLSLELNPTSDADRGKLARAEEMLEARRQRAEWEAVIEGRSQPVATSLLVRESIQRVAALAGAVLCAIILVMATLVSVSENTGLTAGSDAPIPTRLRPRPREVVMLDTFRERGLMRRLTEAAAGGTAQVGRVSVDPRAESADLRLFLPVSAREGRSRAELRLLTLREAYRLARELHRLDSTFAVIHVYVVSPSRYPGSPAAATAEPDMLLAGSLSAKDLVLDAETATPQELDRFFSEVTRPLWSPELALAE